MRGHGLEADALSVAPWRATGAPGGPSCASARICDGRTAMPCGKFLAKRPGTDSGAKQQRDQCCELIAMRLEPLVVQPRKQRPGDRADSFVSTRR